MLSGSLGACSALTPPTAKSIEGLSPAGTVNLRETFVTGAAEGSGTLDYQGQRYPFRLVGTVLGPGGGLSKINAAGDVYKLSSVADFPGRYTQGTGAAGLARAGAGDLWLQNSAGVIMHLKDTSSGALLTLGRDEILIRMSQ
jgi:hypothetical protein